MTEPDSTQQAEARAQEKEVLQNVIRLIDESIEIAEDAGGVGQNMALISKLIKAANSLTELTLKA